MTNLNGIILHIACNQLLCRRQSYLERVDSVNIGSFKESVCIIVTHCSISASCCHRKNSCHNSRNFKSLMLLSGNRDDLLIQFLISNWNIGNLRRTGRSGCRLRRRSGRFLECLLLEADSDAAAPAESFLRCFLPFLFEQGGIISTDSFQMFSRFICSFIISESSLSESSSSEFSSSDSVSSSSQKSSSSVLSSASSWSYSSSSG